MGQRPVWGRLPKNRKEKQSRHAPSWRLSSFIASQPTLSPRVRAALSVASLPHNEHEMRRGRFVSRILRSKQGQTGQPQKSKKTLRSGGEPRGRKSCWIKAGGRFGVPRRLTSPRNAGRKGFRRGSKIRGWGQGGDQNSKETRCEAIFEGSKRGYDKERVR